MDSATVDPSVIALGGLMVAGLAAAASPLAAVVTTVITNRHQRQQAREDRRQRRLEQTYGETVHYLLRIRDYADRVEPILKWTGDPEPPEPQPDDALRRVEAAVVRDGSVEVLNGLEALSKIMREFQANVWLLRTMRERPSPTDDSMKAWNDVEASRNAAREKVAEVHRRINRELNPD